jgi:sulfur carrier protein
MHMTETVKITVNGAAREIGAGNTVAGLLAELGLQPRLVVVEHNRVILDREAYDRTELGAGDVLELVHFVGGG